MNEQQREQLIKMSKYDESDEDIVYYDVIDKRLSGSIVKKAQQLVDHDCIQYVRGIGLFGSKYGFVCLPLNDEEKIFFKGIEFTKLPYERNYNKRSIPYYLFQNNDGMWECNCQGWQTKKKQGLLNNKMPNCKHHLALLKYFKHKHKS